MLNEKMSASRHCLGLLLLYLQAQVFQVQFALSLVALKHFRRGKLPPTQQTHRRRRSRSWAIS
jgi:hypothetical protein